MNRIKRVLGRSRIRQMRLAKKLTKGFIAVKSYVGRCYQRYIELLLALAKIIKVYKTKLSPAKIVPPPLISKSIYKTFSSKGAQSNPTTPKPSPSKLPENNPSITIIESLPNPEQTRRLKIRFAPNNKFAQGDQYLYPVVKIPKKRSLLTLPRQGRAGQRGYKEQGFYSQIKSQIPDIEVTNSVHMVIPHYPNPYEPDVVLFDKKLNLYIDIEIDEPYNGYARYPTHSINPENGFKQDNVRDQFFTDKGWIVIRFTEKQVHCQAAECISLIKNILNAVRKKKFTTEIGCEKEEQWDSNKCIEWQKTLYREKYLGINGFGKREITTKIINSQFAAENGVKPPKSNGFGHKTIDLGIDINRPSNRGVKNAIKRQCNRIKNVIKPPSRNDFGAQINVAFDEVSHIYCHPKDKTGNAVYPSVTTLIERFFPFDQNRYVERKATLEKRAEEEVLLEYLNIRDEAAEKGTFLHNQIEKFLKGAEFDSNTIEFELFLSFYNKEIEKRDLIFFAAEKRIFSSKYNVAGTIDCLFKKNDKDEYVMLDWKRSKKLIIDSSPRIFGYGYALAELSHLDNSSYYKYCLQQNIYKLIVEDEFGVNISSMKLVVLHENNSDYHVINVPKMDKEARIVLNSPKYKI